MPKPKRLRPPYRAMIVAPQPEAVEAGHDVLAAGGNAIDAVIACALTQGVVDPMMCGIGGLGVLQIFDPASGRHLVLDGLSACAAACTPPMWVALFERECSDGYGYVLKGGVNELGHCAVTTPGIMRVFGDAHAA
ncbi:MAG: gamma-glutamyltransferase, partial [Hyphomicrobiales bacterium]|nr:gamma-glutamyltransferase [Hyphomicrobiales bacterium]